jgi:nicotinate-nucleotide adenylyltransferase
MRRIGIFGGTFDPPHVAHLVLAEWAREQLRLDRVIFVPAAIPPHKQRRRISSAAHRVGMTRAATRGNPGFAVSTVEVRRRGPSYTVDTLRAIRGMHPEASLHLIIGEDSLVDFHTWHQPEEILSLARLAVATRPGTRGTGASARGGRVAWLRAPALDVSSSVIRARVRAGRSIRYMVPDAVARYVAAHRLYLRKR